MYCYFAGKQRHVRLYPSSLLDGENVEATKLSDTRGSSAFCVGLVTHGTTMCLCVAIKRTVMIYELNRTKTRHRKVREIMCPTTVQYIDLISERLCVGYSSHFALYSVQSDGPPVGKFVGRLLVDNNNGYSSGRYY